MLASYFGYSHWRRYQIKEAAAHHKVMIEKIKASYEQEISSIKTLSENGQITSEQATKLKKEALQKLRTENQKILESTLGKIVGEEIKYKKDK